MEWFQSRYHVHIETVLTREFRSAPQLEVQKACGLGGIPRVEIALLREKDFGGRPAAMGMNGL